MNNNKEEIKYNCQGLVQTWLARHSDIINKNSVLTLKINDNKEIICPKESIGEHLYNEIENGTKGTIKFAVDGLVKEIFDIN
jgi:hypothetical protein